jgi:hypothetical protein
VISMRRACSISLGVTSCLWLRNTLEALSSIWRSINTFDQACDDSSVCKRDSDYRKI